jgi:hypothetical protein
MFGIELRPWSEAVEDVVGELRLDKFVAEM